MIRFAMAAVAVAILAACAGTPIKWDDARKLRPGMTEAEVTQLVGRPYSVTSRGADQIWVWSQANGMTGSSQSMSVLMRDGRVADVPAIPSSFK